MKSIRAFWWWLVEEEIIKVNPFSKLKIPKPPKKVIATFSQYQLQPLLSVISSSAESYRDMVIILVLLDTGLRVNELINLKVENVWLEEGLIKVLGKGNKERLVPIGKQVRKLVWRYITQCRPEPARPNLANLFLNRDGRPLTKNRVDSIIKRYGKIAGLTGVRCSPHTLRHTFAINFLRNGGDFCGINKICDVIIVDFGIIRGTTTVRLTNYQLMFSSASLNFPYTGSRLHSIYFNLLALK